LQFARYEGKEDIFVFGDSHSDFCFSGIPRCRVHWLGPMTMHRVGRDGLGAVNLNACRTPEGVAAVFIFGEIDIRAHVMQQRDREGRELCEVIETLCANYFRTIRANRELYEELTIVVSSVPPPLVGENNPDLPFSSTIDERVDMTRQVNARLRAMCEKHQFRYLDVYQYFSDPSGVMATGISDNVVHVRREFSDIVEYELERVLG
jgi:hypothetical protein